MPDAIQETLVLVKPDGVARNLTGEILRRIEAKGYSITDLKMVEADRSLLEQHYAEHVGKPFYEPLVEFMESGPIVAVRVAGQRVIEGFRSLAGTTDPTDRRARHHPRRLRPRLGPPRAAEPRARQRQPRVRRPRARPLVRLSTLEHGSCRAPRQERVRFSRNEIASRFLLKRILPAVVLRGGGGRPAAPGR